MNIWGLMLTFSRPKYNKVTNKKKPLTLRKLNKILLIHVSRNEIIVEA